MPNLIGPSDENERRSHANLKTDATNYRLAIANGTVVGTYDTEDDAHAAASEFARDGASFVSELRLVPPGNVVGFRIAA